MSTSRFSLLSFLLLVLLTVFPSCNDDGASADAADIEEPTPAELLALRQQSSVASILKEFADVDSLPPDFEQQKFLPTVGVALNESQPFVRAVRAESAADAERKFRALALNSELLEPTADGLRLTLLQMQWKPQGERRDFGTLTFHRADSQGCVGYVEVEIPCLPELQRLEYLDESAWPDNIAFSSPYKVGQVVYVSSSLLHCYGNYICVKAYAGPKSKGVLVHMERGAGREGQCSFNLDGDDRGCWRPDSPGTVEDFYAFLNFLATKDRVTKKLRQEGYLFSGFDHPDYVYKGSRFTRVIINAVFGDYCWYAFYNWRIVTYVSGPSSSKYGDEFYSGTYEYIKDSSWDSFVQGRDVYTMNVLYFYGETPKGTSLVFDPA